MRDTVVMPGDTYKLFLRNDKQFPHAEVLSVDSSWIEFAVQQADGTFVFEVFPKDMIKKLQSPEDLDKQVWVLTNTEDEAKMTERSLSEDEIVFSRAKGNVVILESRDDAIEYLKELKDQEANEGKLYKVQLERSFGYETI